MAVNTVERKKGKRRINFKPGHWARDCPDKDPGPTEQRQKARYSLHKERLYDDIEFRIQIKAPQSQQDGWQVANHQQGGQQAMLQAAEQHANAATSPPTFMTTAPAPVPTSFSTPPVGGEIC